MDRLDKWRDNLVDEVIVISKRLKLSGDYVESVPRLERMRMLKVVGDIVKDEESQKAKVNAQTRRKT